MNNDTITLPPGGRFSRLRVLLEAAHLEADAGYTENPGDDHDDRMVREDFSEVRFLLASALQRIS